MIVDLNSTSAGEDPAAYHSVAIYDVVVVGGGVVGCAVARLLSHHHLAVAVLEAGPDVGAGTSKANTAILHTGFDAVPGSLEARLVARGYELLREYAPSVGISIEPVGALLVAWDEEQAAALAGLHAKAEANGYERAEIVDRSAVYDAEPHLGQGATAGMVVPDEHIIDPWSTPLAFAYEAIANRATVLVNHEVTSCAIGGDVSTITTSRGTRIRTRFIVNAAGLRGDELHRSIGLDGFTIRPRRGELIVFDKLARPLLNRTVLPVPTSKTKGVLVAPTVFGNVMLGPTADDIDDKTATGSTRAGIDSLLEKGRRILPALLDEEVTSVYAGLRAATEHSDYQVSHQPDLRYVCLGGIRSTGLTSSMALAEEALVRLIECGLTAPPKDDIRTIHLTALGEIDERPYQRGGQVVCHCERVTVGEVAAACVAPVPAVNFDGLRRRTRALAGRCQGFYCQAELCSLTGWGVAP
ncbi:MAG: FAD-dependent oxidoreductase [Ilumatobacteraceae bacterium]